MHEWSLALSLVQTLDRWALERGIQIKRVVLSVPSPAQLDVSILTEAFDTLKKESRLERAKWPVKVAKRYLEALENLENNAKFRGLDTERVVIVHAAAHKGFKIPNIMQRAFGRATRFDEQTVNLELVAVELPKEVVPKRYKLNLVKR